MHARRTPRPRFYDARQVVALPLYLAGGLIWFIAGAFLIVADKIGGSTHSRSLIA